MIYYKHMRMLKLSALIFAAFVISGCSLTGGGSDGGVFRSDDGGKTFVPKDKAENNRTISGVDILSLAVNPQNGSEIYAGSKTSGIFRSSDGGELWKQLGVSQLTPTKVYSLAIDPMNPGTLYAVAVIGKRGKIVKSTDAGETWKDTYSEPSDGSLVLSVAVNPQKPSDIFAGTDQGQIIFSEDSGETWRSAYWTEGKEAVSKIAFDNVNPDTAYFILFEEGILRTTDEGKSFEALSWKKDGAAFSLGSGLGGAVSIAVDPARENWVYAGTSEGLLRSKDRGENWEIVKTLNKPNELNIRSIAINPQNSDEIICTVAQALYKSVDGGVNWLPVQFNTGRTLETAEYNLQNPGQVFVGLNKR